MIIQGFLRGIKGFFYDKKIITEVYFINGSKLKIKEKMPYELITDDSSMWEIYRKRVEYVGEDISMVIDSDLIMETRKLVSTGINLEEVNYMRVTIK